LIGACVEEPPPEDPLNPLRGLYAVTANTEASPCDAAPVDVADGFTEFKLDEESIFFTKILGFFPCNGGLETCDESALLNLSAFGDDNEVSIATSSGDETSCFVNATLGNWEAIDGGVRLETTSRGGTLENVEVCDPDVALAQFDALECQGVDVLEGELIEELPDPED
jgi:hypothetical protein